jgi:Flp pilus assembly protein TadG
MRIASASRAACRYRKAASGQRGPRRRPRPQTVPGRRRRGDAGMLTLFTAIVAVALLGAVGIVVDGGQKIQAAQIARGIAEEAARAGAGQVNASAAYAGGGPAIVDPAQAAAASRQWLSRSDHTGTVTVTGTNAIKVSVTITVPAVFLQIIGVSRLSATGTATADLVEGITGPRP